MMSKKIKLNHQKGQMSMIRAQFNGERLKAARRFNKLTLAELAEKVNVSKQMLSKYEKDLSQPSAEVIMQLESSLGFPRKFFYEKSMYSNSIGNTYFRSLSKATKKDIEAQKLRVDFLEPIFKLIDDYIELPSANVPTFNADVDIEEAAKKLREEWNLGNGPIKNIVELLEVNGLIVSTSKMNIQEIDAYTQTRKINNRNVYFVILGNDKGSYFRRQFDGAHELGHIVLHEPNLDISTLTSEQEKQIEAEANQFASAFLLPEETFTRDVSIMPTNLEHYLFLKKKWHVSVGAMVRRAYSLNLITSAQYTTLQRKMSTKGWRTLEPYDENYSPTKPVLLSEAIKVLLDNNIFNGVTLLTTLADQYELSIHPDMFENLIGLANGTLEKYYPKKKGLVLSLKDLKLES